jgi:hypothetical protein
VQVSNPEVLRILLSIDPSKTMHFQTWQDKGANALAITGTDTGFPGSTVANRPLPLSTACGGTDSANRDLKSPNSLLHFSFLKHHLDSMLRT